MNARTATAVLVVWVVVGWPHAVQAQPNTTFDRTATVDPSGNADFTCIQAAIENIRDNRSSVDEVWTVFIYADEYVIDSNNQSACQPIVLDGDSENINIIGADRDGVVIDVRSADIGIRIVSGTETSRNNAIRNLTIKTSDGHGIRIERGAGGEPPAAIVIDNVTIEAAGSDQQGVSASEVRDLTISDSSVSSSRGTALDLDDAGTVDAPTEIVVERTTMSASAADKMGIDGSDAENVRIVDSEIESPQGIVVAVGDHYEIIGCTLSSERSTKGGVAIRVDDRAGLAVLGSTLNGCMRGIECHIASDDVSIIGSAIRSIRLGLFIETFTDPGPMNWQWLNCAIVGENIAEDGSGIALSLVQAIYLDHPRFPSDVVFHSCRIEAIAHPGDSASPTNVECIQIDNLPGTQFIDCDWRAISLVNDDVLTLGLFTNNTATVLVGGSFETAAPNYAKATRVFDIQTVPKVGKTPPVYATGTRFSKWEGRVFSEGRARAVTQRMINLDAANDDSILVATNLTDGEQTINEQDLDGQPDVYRVLSVTGNDGDLIQDVYIEGTNWANDRIVEKITLDGTNTVNGRKPFKSVTSVILPGSEVLGQTVKIGTTDVLGLYYPVDDATDVLQVGTKSSADSTYTVNPPVLSNVSVDFATYDLATIADGDSVEFAVLTVR